MGGSEAAVVVTPNSYSPGEAVRLLGTFTNEGGTLTTPGAVTLRLIWPAQWGGVPSGTVAYTLASGSLSSPNAGTVQYDLTIPGGTAGVWSYSFAGSAPSAVFVGQFNVYEEPVP